MKTKLPFTQLVAVVVFLFFAFPLSAADWFVKPNASGTGASWDDPCNISVLSGTPAGLADGDMVYLSAGVYESSTSKTVAKYVSVIGGYPANSTGINLPERNLLADSTILSPSAGGTARCLVLNATTAPTLPGQKFLLDGLNFKGFTMATGNGGTALNITNAQSNIDIKNCSFQNNVSLNANGGAISMGSFAYNITIAFENCNFIGNQANWSSANGYGGAAYFNNGTTAKTINFTGCNFTNNTAYGRGGALYFTSSITSNITDCYFDSNYSSNTTDNYANGNGGCIYVAGGTASNTFNLTRTVIVNSSGTAKGSVFWFNTTPKNYLNLTNCSLIGNYAKRTSSARAAIDADNLTTNIEVTLNGSVMSNYNWSGGAKTANRADLIFLSAPTSNAATTSFTNSILNGVYFATGNALDAVSPSVLYTTTGYLADSTIALALSGDLKITDKIVFKKVFTAENKGTYLHDQIFDVKKKMGFPMTLIAGVPAGYILRVDGTDFLAGDNIEVNIPASVSDPVITLRTDTSTGFNSGSDSGIKILMQKGSMTLTGIQTGSQVTLYNTSGQAISNRIATADNMVIDVTGLVVVKVYDGQQTSTFKTFVK